MSGGYKGAEMDTLLLMLVTFFGYILVYKTYGKFLSGRVFRLDDSRKVPSQEFEDGVDYVPSRKSIVFGHHFASIAGTGPIVGPAIGIIWGWVPALLWVFFGAVLIGGMHDLGSLVISLRNKGKTLTEVTAKFVNPRVRLIFFLIVFFELWIVIAIFGLIIAIIFNIFPASVIPVWFQIPIAVGLGWVVHRRGGSVMLYTAVAVALLYLSIWAGNVVPVSISGMLGLPPTGLWTIVLLIYAFVASTLPVTMLLQPRDFVNAWQLFITMGLMAVGALVAGGFHGMHIVAPAFNASPSGAPPLWPFLFITIACGACSGFHCIVSSGTSSKQTSCETDSTFIGYGSMLLESALATLVLIAVGAGIGIGMESDSGLLTGSAAWNHQYNSWTAAGGLTSKLRAVVVGSANMMSAVGVPSAVGTVIMGVFIATFAGTTLDTATRTQRYIISELFSDLGLQKMSGRYTTTSIAVLTAALLAFVSGADGKGALTLWPMFGAINQLLAALALMLITIYLQQRKGWYYLLSGIPCLFMVGSTGWAMVINQINFMHSGQIFLATVNAATIILAFWMVIEAGIKIFGPRPEPSPD